MLRRYLLLSLLFLPVFVGAQELVTLTTPIASPNATNVRLRALHIDMFSKTVTIDWVVRSAAGGDVFTEHAEYPTPAPLTHPTQPTGAVLINTLNTANLTANSLVHRAITRLQTDGYIASGTVSGTPE